MIEISAVEIAKKQRYLHLLQKVKENKTLSKVELDELGRYERKMADKVILGNLKKRSTKPSIKSSTKPSTKRPTKQSKKSKRKRKARLPVNEVVIRRLGLECENLTEADAAIRADATIRTRKSLSEILKKHSRLRQAWDRGRFLRNLRGLARTGASVTEAAKKLGFANGRVLRTMIDEDQEVGDLWDQAQLEVYIEIKSAIVEAAKEGKPAAVRAVESFLLDEKDRPGFDPSRITTLQLTELIGKTRKTIHEWHTKFGLPRNADKTFDLSIFFAWFEEYLLKRISVGEKSVAALDPLRAMRAEKLKVEIASHRNELVDRNDIVIGQVAWVQNIISICDRNIEELSRLCCNQPREKIEEIHRVFFRDLHSAAVNIPKELRLPAAQERKLKKILQELKPSDEKGEVAHDN